MIVISDMTNKQNPTVDASPEKSNHYIYFNGKGRKFSSTELKDWTNVFKDSSENYSERNLRSKRQREETHENMDRQNSF